MTKTFSIWKIVYITVIFKDEYIRFGFCKAITHGIFRGVECGSWERGEMSSSDCGSSAQGRTWSALTWSLTSKPIFNIILLMHFTGRKRINLLMPLWVQRNCTLRPVLRVLRTEQFSLPRSYYNIILCLTYWLKFIFLFNFIYH